MGRAGMINSGELPGANDFEEAGRYGGDHKRQWHRADLGPQSISINGR